MSDLLSGFFGSPKPKDPLLEVMPPPPNPVHQSKPTHIEASGIKYHAFNIDKISFDVVNKGGFNNVTPDLLVWDQYHYNVQEFIAHADEQEISKFIGWALKDDKEIQGFKIDFSHGGQTQVSGKYHGIIPFTVDISISKTQDNKLIFSFDSVHALFQMPDKIKDMLISSLLDIKETPGMFGGLQLKPAFVRIGDDKIMFDPARINPRVNIPIKFFETTDTGIKLEGGSEERTTEPEAKTEPQKQAEPNTETKIPASILEGLIGNEIKKQNPVENNPATISDLLKFD